MYKHTLVPERVKGSNFFPPNDLDGLNELNHLSGSNDR